VDGDDCHGVCYREDADGKNEIAISRKVSEGTQASVLVHEVCHAVLGPLKLHNKTEERIVLRLEEGLASFLRDNPTLARRVINSLRR